MTTSSLKKKYRVLRWISFAITSFGFAASWIAKDRVHQWWCLLIAAVGVIGSLVIHAQASSLPEEQEGDA